MDNILELVYIILIEE